ncbi:MAG TPA: response regulator, partial [Candidatus Eisenbacteria bacterium]|nr:response regulator [Candidatus Eisenbacteria bacterium]
MATKISMLVVEDSESDSALTVRELERAGYEIVHARVETEAALRAALLQTRWDIVISDYNVPGFGGAAALQVVREIRTDVPFIFVSGTIGEETAVSAIRAGANDYVMKSNLARLAPAVERELREVAARDERRELENQLRQAQKMEAVGRLAGGVAHDFNNLLTAIMGYAQLASGRLPADHQAQSDVQEIMSASERAAMLTRQLLAFSRKEVVQTRVLDLGALVVDMAKMLRRIVGEEIQMHVRSQEGLGGVKADIGQMEQVILNLIVNA